MLSVGAAPLLSAYVAAKHAHLGWSDSLRLELSGSGIDVSNVPLPSVATPMFDHGPTRLPSAPKPIPPTYDVEVASRAVLGCLRRPRRRHVPLFLQGRLVLWVDRVALWLGRAVLSRWGERWQQRRELPPPRDGNLFEPVLRGIGPRGTVRPTPRWALAGAALALTGLLARLAYAGGIAARALGAKRFPLAGSAWPSRLAPASRITP